MKNLFHINIFFVLFLVLTACGQPLGITPTPVSPTITLNPGATRTADIITPTVIGMAPTLIPTPTPEPTLLPTIEPTIIPGLLGSSFVVQTLAGMNGHSVHRITGWEYGFRPSGYCFGPYKWLNQDHLLLFPLTGQDYGMGTMQLSLPMVINYERGNVWIPAPDDLFSLSSCQQPLWSNTLNVLIATQGRETIVFTPDGDIVNRYPGINASLSPSGTKLVAGGRWIDLLSGKQVDFSSQGIEGLSTWSSDENQLYSCCYAYGNVRTGKASTFELSGLRYVGRDYGDGFTGIKNMWVMNDTYIVSYWDFQNDAEDNIFPFIEPSTQTYKKLQDLTDIPDDTSCRLGSVAPNRKLIWANCYQPNNYVVNLETFAVDAYSGQLDLISWSSDSNFAWLRTFINDDPPQILSVVDKELQSLPVQPLVETIFWHPNASVLAYLSQEKQTLVFVDASTMVVQEFALPATFRNISWNPNGEYMALLADDGSLWQVDYPGLENLEQLTPSLPDVSEVNWSPDGNSFAFVSGSDIYVVNVVK